MVAAALLAVWLTVLAGAGLFLAWRQLQREKADLVDLVTSWFEKPGPDQASQVEMAAHAIAHIAAEEIKQSLSGAMMGHASALSRQLQAAEGDLVADQVQAANPLMSMLLNFSPSLRKRVAKNPMAAMALAQLPIGDILRKVAGGGQGSPAAPRNGGGQGGFELGK